MPTTTRAEAFRIPNGSNHHLLKPALNLCGADADHGRTVSQCPRFTKHFLQVVFAETQKVAGHENGASIFIRSCHEAGLPDIVRGPPTWVCTKGTGFLRSGS